MASLTATKDPRNSRAFKGNGTEVWHPPEQFHSGDIDVRWRQQDIHPRGYSNYPYDQRHGVWAIAAIIYGLCSLNQNNIELMEILQDIKHDRDAEDKRRRWNLSMLKGLKYSFKEDYSDALFNLVDACLNLNPRQRPWPEKIVQECERCMSEMGRQAERERVAIPKVCYGINGLNELRDEVRRRRNGPRPPPRRKSRRP
jgi:serine/threonine protein kinase